MYSYYGDYRTDTFTEVHADDWTLSNDHRWDTPQYFLDDWHNTFYYTESVAPTLTDNTILLIYHLLYANYANSCIASSDEGRFKAKLFTVIFQYAPSWKSKLAIQDKLRALDLDSGDLFIGTKAIYNQASNPQTPPSTATLEEVTYINNQSTTGYKRSKLDAYSNLWELLKADVTDAFMKQFSKLFITIVSPDKPLLYETEIEDEE